jgi:hypothetical protein
MPLPDGTFINVFLATDPRLRVSRLGEFRGITLLWMALPFSSALLSPNVDRFSAY